MITDNAELNILSEISKIASSTIVLSERLKFITEITSQKMNTETCNICLFDDDKETLILKASTGLKQEAVDRVKMKIGSGITGWVAEKKKHVALRNAQTDSRFLRFPEIGEEQFRALLSVPIMDGNDCIGVITVQSEDEREYSETEVELLKTISNQICGAIKNAQLYHKATQRLSKLILLHKIGQALSSTLELPDLFNLIVRNSCKIVNASASILWLKEKKWLRNKAYYSLRDDLEFAANVHAKYCITNNMTEHNNYLLLNNNDKTAKKFILSAIHSLLCIPLVYRSKILGILCVVDKKKEDISGYKSFSKDDIQFLSTIASHAVIAIDNAYAYEHSEQLDAENRIKIKELSVLYEISLAMQSTIRLNKLLRIILGCVTAGGGFGFDRAMLLLLNEKTHTLQGMMGLETDISNETGEIWQRLSQKNQTLLEWLTSEEANGQKESRYNTFVKTLRIPIKKKGCVLSSAVVKKQLFNITDARSNHDVDKDFLERLGVNSFAVVPIIAKENILGVLVVDNFYNSTPITENDLQFLSRFAIHAGWAMENARLFTKLMEKNRELVEMQDRLIQSERLATLGRFSAEVAHEIKNPLVSIGGFARRLYETTKNNTKEKQYSQIIVKEVERLEKMLKDILNFSSVKKPSLTSHNINTIIEETLSLYREEMQRKNIDVKLRLYPHIQEIKIDQYQISQVLINLILNSIDSMPDGGKLSVETKVSDRFSDGGVMFTIKDTGGGVPMEALHNIFNPFFTTKKSGTGLGLTLIRKIIESHGGILELENKPGVGINFIINLPANK